MQESCSICGGSVEARMVRVRSGSELKLHNCINCCFEYFKHDLSADLAENKLDESRLKSAGLDIPNIDLDFQNGTEQSKALVQQYLVDADRGSNMLEVGCSVGYFLKLIKDFGCKPYGVEINKSRNDYVNKALEIPCFTDLGLVEEKGLKFRKIFLFYVLEYIPHPVAYLSRLLDLLEEGGSLICITPNLGDSLKDIWGNKGFKDFFYDEYAVNYMSTITFEVILSKLRYKKADVKTWQGYSFASHLSWYFTQKPSTTGIVGGDDFVSDITVQLDKAATNKKLPENQRSAAQKITRLFHEFDRNYRSALESEDCGNQIHITITR